MRIFYVEEGDQARRIADYLIKGRIGFQISYTFPDVIKGPPRYVFKLPKHVSDSAIERGLFLGFLASEKIQLVVERYD